MAALKQRLREQKAQEAADVARASSSHVEMLDVIPGVIVEVKADSELDKETVKVSLFIAQNFNEKLTNIQKMLTYQL